MAEHAAVQPHPMNSARNWETKPRGEGLAAGNRNVYGVPTALLKKSIITSRFTEARSQLQAAQTKREFFADISMKLLRIISGNFEKFQERTPPGHQFASANPGRNCPCSGITLTAKALRVTSEMILKSECTRQGA